ncbi:hypothetical protein SODALDRAFT_334988 [Sodiomyces alkalinus F11]|uniref:Prion-inhibition and propagation HeLo domain-containing protein n=1 Tax=Sodiomyces alkalinus (strain CBS 110278 / VKM F-3762 / F11) TaxID=1314773 RepID=A0A3N2PQQ3_SODAK|nr:hypothetical protein SODALDRAFT_334988 [Sodiomyces alkalinus F11]ROT36790.1 hypothetical protein SODALDRAFT_334988 [Sodiomyces alkalinus F11]
MEAVSAISSLVPTIIQEFGAIQVARGFQHDFKLYQLRLDMAQLRLSRWSTAAGLPLENEGENTGTSSPEGDPASTAISDLEQAEIFLEHIRDALIKAKNESEKMKPRNADDAPFPNDRFGRLQRKVRGLVVKRCRKTATQVSGVKWALYKTEQCEALITNISELIEQLEKLVEPQSKLEELTREECEEMSGELMTILDVIRDCEVCDPYLLAAATQALEEKKATLQNTNVSAGTNYGMMVGRHNGNVNGVQIRNTTITNGSYYSGKGYTANHGPGGGRA